MVFRQLELQDGCIAAHERPKEEPTNSGATWDLFPIPETEIEDASSRV